MKLLDYLKKNKMTQRNLAKKVGVSEVLINYVVHKKQNPSATLIKRIEKATNKEVTFDDLFDEKLSSTRMKKRVDE